MYLLCIVVHCASVLSHTSDGWRHAFTYRWINVYKPLFITYVRTYVGTYAYMSLCSHSFPQRSPSKHPKCKRTFAVWNNLICYSCHTHLCSLIWDFLQIFLPSKFGYYIRCIERITTARIRLHECAAWSAPLLFACN